MRKSFVIVFLLIISLLTAENPKEKNEINGPRRPLYEKVPFIRDYRINQPILGIVRWGPIAFGVGYVGATLYLNEGQDQTKWNLKEASGIGWEISKISMLPAALYGIYSGFKAQNIKNNDPSYFIDSKKIGYEVSLMLDPFPSSDACTNKINSSIILTYDHQYRFINEFQFNLVWVKWPDLEETIHVFEEIKYGLRGIHYYRNGQIFSPYYGLGGGLSYGKRRHDEWYHDDNNVVSEGIYPFAHSSAGIRISMMDFFYLKIEADFELSSFYLYASSYEDYSFLTSLSLGMVVGAKIF